MTTPAIPTFDQWLKEKRDVHDPYNPESEVLCNGPPKMANRAGKRVVVVGETRSGKSELINALLAIPDLCKTTRLGEPSSRVTYTYQYHEHTNIAAFVHYFARVNPVAVRVSYADDAITDDSDIETDDLDMEPAGVVKVDDTVCADIASFHAAISEYTDSPKCIVKEVGVSVKSPILAGGATLVELPGMLTISILHCGVT
jgi:energy-coupling factor transporter ATP-binding protein EcfA2